MTSRQQIIRANKLRDIIKEHGRIHKYDLINKANMSISTYEKIKPWFEFTFPDFVRYDRTTLEWEWIVKEN